VTLKAHADKANNQKTFHQPNKTTAAAAAATTTTTTTK